MAAKVQQKGGQGAHLRCSGCKMGRIYAFVRVLIANFGRGRAKCTKQLLEVWQGKNQKSRNKLFKN